MASAMPVLSREETNFLRVVNLLIRLSPKAIRILFNREFNPGGLKIVFTMNKKKLDKLKNTRVITQPQWNLLFPHGSEPNSNEFDLTLMICLLRNLTKVTIKDQLPQTSDMSEGAAVSRIKFYRNKIAHSETGTMSDAKFREIFADVSRAIEILCPAMILECRSLKNADLDHSFHDIYVEFVKNEKQIGEIRKQQEEFAAQVEALNAEGQNIKSIQTKEISDWKKKLEKFYLTEAATKLIEVVKDNQCTVITGVPGSGKSAIAYYVAMHLQKTESFTVLPLFAPSELLKIANVNTKQIFVFDDVFGKYSLNEYNLNCWESETARFKTLLKDQFPKIMITCRSYLYNFVKDSLSTLSFAYFNLQSLDVNISLEERKEISKLYLTDDVVCQLNDEIIMMYNFFPLLCVMFHEQKMRNADFFQNPNQFLKTEIENFKTKNDLSFIALALLVLSNNSIEKECFQIGNCKYDSLLKDLFNEIDAMKTLTKTSIFSNLQNLKNMYLTETESIMCTKHDKIFDIISHTIGKFIIRCILRHGKPAFISSRLQLESLNEEHDDLTIMISDELESVYFNRLLKDMDEGCNWEVFANIQMKFEKYRNLFMRYLEKLGAKFSTSEIDGTTPLHVTAAKGYFDMSKYLLEQNGKQIRSLDFNSRSPLYNASMNGHHTIAHLFLTKGAQVEQTDYAGCTPLLASCYNGCLKITEELLKNHANVNTCDNNSWCPLHAAALGGNTGIIELLIMHEATVDRQMNNGMTALYISSEEGHLCAVDLLLKHAAEVNKVIYKIWSPLSIACWKGHKEIAKLLLENGAEVDKLDGNGRTLLYTAAKYNNTEIIKLLIDQGASVNLASLDGMRPIDVACSFGTLQTVKMLLNCKADVNLCEPNGRNPLLFACCSEQIDIVVVLVDHSAALVNLTNNEGETPLHIACKNDNEDIVKILLNHGAATGLCDVNGIAPLHSACLNGSKNVAELLIKQGATVNKDDKDGQTPLHLACNTLCYELVLLLITNGAVINTYDAVGHTALHNAASIGNCDVIKTLIEHGADVNYQMSEGMTPLYMACCANHLEAVKTLLNHKADANKCEIYGWTPLHVASFYDQKDTVSLLCENSNSLINASNNEGKTPLHIACEGDNEDIVKLLFDFSALVDQCDENGYTPLHTSCYNGNLNVAELLIKQGATVNKGDRNGQTPIHLASNKLCNELVLLLITNGAVINTLDAVGLTSLHNAASIGNCDTIKTLIEHGADVNCQMINGETPLYMACGTCHIEAVKTLLNHKADANKCEIHGRSPLHRASFYNQKEISAFLCEDSHALINMSNNEGKTPLHIACDEGNKDIVKLLLNFSASLHKFDENGYTPLHSACINGNKIIVDKLIKQDAGRVNVCNEEGITPLHIACKRGNKDIVKLLIKRGASTSYCDETGSTPLHLACCEGNKHIVNMLIKTITEINKIDKNGKTPLYIACEEGNIDIVELLIKRDASINHPDMTNETPLFAACLNRYTVIVELLLTHGAELNTESKVERREGWTALHATSAYGYRHISDLLLKNLSNVNSEDNNGHTPLYYAAKNNHVDVVNLLIRYGGILGKSDVKTPSVSTIQKQRKHCKMQ